MNDIGQPYLPAAGRKWALPLYDPFVKLTGVDRARKALIEQADLRAALRVLDVGCGTGSLAVAVKRRIPSVDLVCLDPDADALAKAARKAGRAGFSVRFDCGYSQELPYRDASFDRVFSSFMFHHIRAESREATLCEIRRVLRSGGSFHMLDFAKPDEQRSSWLTHVGHLSKRLRDNSEERILALLSNAGFTYSRKVLQGSTVFGLLPIAYYCAGIA